MKNNKIYEISFWLKNDIESSKEIKDLLEKFNFEIIFEAPLRSKQLAYAIQKQKIGKFGTIYFYGVPEKMGYLKDELKKNKSILRYIILRRKQLKTLNNGKITNTENIKV